MGNNIPPDILHKIDEMFPDKASNEKALNSIRKIFEEENWGVGQAQLARSVLFLADGKLPELQNIMTTIEPRDTILQAEIKAGNHGHYFTKPFNQC